VATRTPTTPATPIPEREPQDRRERRRAETRERLLTAALELFAAQGFVATTYEHIAERADTGRQTAFNHFRRKEDFVLAWVQRRHDLLDLLDRRERDADAAGDLTALEVLAEEMRALAELNEQEYALLKELHDAGVLHSAFSLGSTTPHALLAAVTRGQQRDEIRSGLDPETVADLVFDAYIGTLSRWLRADGGFALAEALLARLDVLATGFRVA